VNSSPKTPQECRNDLSRTIKATTTEAVANAEISKEKEIA